MNKHPISEGLSIGKLKEILSSTLGSDLIQEGFSFNKKQDGAKKKINGKNSIEVKFDFYDYLPSRVEFRLIFVFTITEIDKEAEKLYKYCQEHFNKGWTIVLTEGDFHPKLKYLEPKIRNAATHILTDFAMTNEAIEDCRYVLQNEIIPNLPKYSVLEEFQNYVLNDFDAVIRLGLTVPALIAAKLKGKEELKKMVDFIWIKLELNSKAPQHFMRRLVEGVLTYSH